MSDAMVFVFGVALAAITLVVLVLLYRNGKISASGISAIGEIVGNICDFMPKESLFTLLGNYVRKAVLAVEQLVSSGQLEKDDEIRKTQALTFIEQFAVLDGIELNDDDKAVASSLIEAEVALLPHGS